MRFLFQDLFPNRCLILQVAQDFGQSCWVGYWDVKCLTIRQNPAFGPQQIRELTGIFVEKAIEVNSSFDETFIIHNCETFHSYVTSGVEKSSSMMV